jgi:DNA-binding response OmpR family regulator
MARVLLVDDDLALLVSLAVALEGAGHVVDQARDGREALARITAARPEIVISDVAMPNLDGFTLCRRLRDAGDRMPLILLTARDSEIDEALGLELGADDYVTKPFRTRVLLLRIEALLRRATAPDDPESLRVVGPLRLDRGKLEVTFHGTPITVTLTEFRLLDALTTRPGIVLSRDALLEATRDDDSVVAARLIDTYVHRLRRRFGALGKGELPIETVVGAGYRYRA